jgi:4-amino-4-deoxy-L-arabinose transferase-like glycosyltransferase
LLGPAILHELALGHQNRKCFPIEERHLGTTPLGAVKRTSDSADLWNGRIRSSAWSAPSPVTTLLSESKPSDAIWRRTAAERWQSALPLAIFAGTVLLLWILFAHRLILGTNDEGIYLDAAERIVRGQKLYVDFFGYMSPGSFWTQAFAFRLFGITQAAARVPVIFDLALECALIFWLVNRYTSRACALATALFFLAFEIADPSMITAQHRWDSGALALASIAICVAFQEKAQEKWLMASGFLVACAACVTPPVALVAIVTVLWLRGRAAWYLVGASMAACVAGLALWLDGIFPAFLRQLQWLSRNYSAVNVMHYGSIIGGYRALFAGTSVWEMPIRLCVVLCLVLPAVLPIVALAGGVALWRRQPGASFLYLALCVAALVISTHPRSDVAHLAYIAALPYALAGIVIYRFVPARPRAWILVFFGVWAAVFARQALAGPSRTMETPVGEVRANAAETPAVVELLARVQPHQTLFVYPYKPLFYFLTQAENPARFSYLQPGLMTSADAALVLSELKAHPPDWVLYLDLSQAEFDRVFPSGKDVAAHFPEIENWIRANYSPTGAHALGGYVLLQRAAPKQ